MLAVFEKSISKTPIELSLPGVRTGRFNRSPEEIAELFGSWKSDSTFYHVSNCNFLALSHIDEYYPRSIVVMDDIYCIFSGALDNSSELRQLYGLSKKAAEATIIVEAYKMLCDRAPYPPGQVIADLQGSFAFILFDRRDSVLFLASDRDAHVRLYWGTATDGSLVCADDQNVISTCCGNAYTTFPRGKPQAPWLYSSLFQPYSSENILRGFID
ncbi:stem-specific protein tsjt1 [Phtheirospermum japonicum]|uniref:Stem-specific protein tsjt1 n=1 Tax=Phtheirospermum japonicum TaxID=374723 RepID=A0A830CGT2_9LAMI|nr:stem-specific protein tsjt1 [Phtheirospermum japonicum]